MARFIDRYSGRRFGRLVVEKYDRVFDEPPRRKAWFWWCACDCGERVSVSEYALRNGTKKSCGCLRQGRPECGGTKKRDPSTRWKATAERVSWQSMIQRCTNPKSKSYPRYGGRGIRICDAWLDFSTFLRGMVAEAVAGVFAGARG